MALTVTTTPTIAQSLDSSQTLTVFLTGSGNPYWESDNGTFSAYLNENPTFTPRNVTKTTSIIGRRVLYMQSLWSGLSNVSNTAPYGSLTKTGGVDGNADAGAISSDHSNNADTFYEFTTAENNKLKAAGFYGSVDMEFAWRLYANGTARAEHSGASITATIPYVANDIFRIAKIGNNVIYSINGVIYYTLAVSGTFNLYPRVLIYGSNGTVNKNLFFKKSGTTEGTLTFQVYSIFPGQPNYSYEINLDSKVLASVAEDGSATYRIKGQPNRTWNLQFTDRPLSELDAVYSYWLLNDKVTKFYYKDLVYSYQVLVTFDSGLRIQTAGPDRISFSCTVKQVANAPIIKFTPI